MSSEPLTPYAEFLLREQVRGLEQMLAICRAALSATTAAAAAPSPVPQTPAETAAEAATEALASAVAESVLAPAPAVPMPEPTAVPEPVPEPAPEPTAVPEPVPEPAPEPTAVPEPVAVPEPAVPMPTVPMPAPEPMPVAAVPMPAAVPEPAPEPMPAWNTVRRVRPPPKVIGSPINKSQRPLYQRSDIVHGEKALATSTGKTSLTAMDIETAEQLIIHGDATEFRGFYHKRSNTLFQSPTAACTTLLKRNGVSTSWQGGAHIWLERGGKWVKLNKIINNM